MQMETPATSPLKFLVRAIGMRLRFLLAVGAFALLMSGWPWIRSAWDVWVVSRLVGDQDHAVSIDTEFFCPMDPGVLSAWPAICPLCNMDLITRKKLDAVLLPEGVLARMQLSPYRVQLAGVRTEPVQVDAPENKSGAADTQDSARVYVPFSAVVHRDNGPIVYVETMAGMFDALPVKLGLRQSERYEVLSGLQAGQRVVSVGAFLIDAETRLNPSVATQYFGANQQNPTSLPPTLKQRPIDATASSLTAFEQELVTSQSICPVTGAPLGSMGGPVIITVDGRPVALCCIGCEKRFIADKEKYFAMIDNAGKTEP